MRKTASVKKKTAVPEVLLRDPALGPVIRKAGPITGRRDPDLYKALLRAIVGQQLSVKAAATIWARFIALFPDGYPQAELLLSLDDSQLRGCGLSGQKVGYVKNIARFSKERSLQYSELRKFDDEQLISYLTEIKGVGRWTVEMILMFSLRRPDVLPLDDLGIQTAMVSLYGIRAKSKKEMRSKLAKIAENWRPHRTLACMYLWRHKDTVPA